MSFEETDDGHLRKYLLGELSEAEQQAFEERLLREDELFELLPLAEEELIDDYLGGELSQDERGRFESYFLATPDRRRKLSFAMALRRYVIREAAVPALKPSPVVLPRPTPSLGRPSLWWKQTFSSPYLKLAAAVVIMLTAGLGTWRVFFYQSEVERGLAALARAYGNERPVEARISGLSYAPYSRTRGTGDLVVDTPSRDVAERILLDAVVESPSPAAHHALGEFYLAERRFEDAINQFDRALKDDPDNAKLHSDFGAVYLESSLADPAKPRIGDLAKSLKLLNRASELDGSLLAAHFNKALCLQRMNAATAAKQAWEDYLKRDPNSEWSKEAERNLQLLQGQSLNTKTPGEVLEDFLKAYRCRDESLAWRIQSQTKEMITGTMIPFQLAREFTECNLSNQSETGSEMLRAFRFVGEMEKKRSGDPFFAELAAFYSEAGTKQAVVLKRAHDELAQGYRLCLEGRYNSAVPLFNNARRAFLQAGDTWESKVVDYWLAYCLSYGAELKASSTLFWTLAEECQRQSYHWLESQSYCWLGNNSALEGEYSQGIELDRKALHLAAASEDSYAVQKASSQIADRYKFFGRLKESLEFNRQSLPSPDFYFVSRRQLWRSLQSITDTLFALRLYSAAEAYQQEALLLALNSFNDAALTHSTYRRLGQIYAGQENYSAAQQALELSLKALEPIAEDPIFKRLRGLSILQIASVKRQIRDCSSALEYYRLAAREFDSSEFELYNYNTHKGMLLCYLLEKDDAAIQQELPTVLSFFERNRKRIKEEQNRNAFFDTEQSIYELAIEYELERNNNEQSFYYAQLSKARSLQDAIVRRTTEGNDELTPLTVPLLKERLPADLQLVEYAVLQDRLLIWFLTKTDFEVIVQPLPMVKLEALTTEYLQLLPRSDSNSIEREKQLAAELYNWVFAPVEKYLNKDSEVALVPDKFLFEVPFAALLSRESGERVVSNFDLLYAPSSTVLVLCSDLARMKSQDKATERLLSVGDPLLNYEEHSDLRSLPSARIEAESIASFYLTKAVFLTGHALKRQIESEMGESDVIHFAAHYVTDEFEPGASRLLLTANQEAKTGQTSSDLSLQEIQDMRLPRVKAAVLSACQSGIERYYAGEGLVGLSRAFLMARVPLVIASQWAVASDSTADLMIEFHKLRKVKNLKTTEALRRAQLAMLSHEDERYRRPYYWAAFFPIGGHALY